MSFPWHGWHNVLTISLDKPFEVLDEANPDDESSNSVSEAICTSVAPEVEGKEISFALDCLNSSWRERDRNKLTSYLSSKTKQIYVIW
jgi:hypothetical protein